MEIKKIDPRRIFFLYVILRQLTIMFSTLAAKQPPHPCFSYFFTSSVNFPAPPTPKSLTLSKSFEIPRYVIKMCKFCKFWFLSDTLISYTEGTFRVPFPIGQLYRPRLRINVFLTRRDVSGSLRAAAMFWDHYQTKIGNLRNLRFWWYFGDLAWFRIGIWEKAEAGKFMLLVNKITKCC